jgi:hypothetical protein
MRVPVRFGVGSFICSSAFSAVAIYECEKGNSPDNVGAHLPQMD